MILYCSGRTIWTGHWRHRPIRLSIGSYGKIRQSTRHKKYCRHHRNKHTFRAFHRILPFRAEFLRCFTGLQASMYLRDAVPARDVFYYSPFFSVARHAPCIGFFRKYAGIISLPSASPSGGFAQMLFIYANLVYHTQEHLSTVFVHIVAFRRFSQVISIPFVQCDVFFPCNCFWFPI